jgi:hypothetical protein
VLWHQRSEHAAYPAGLRDVSACAGRARSTPLIELQHRTRHLRQRQHFGAAPMSMAALGMPKTTQLASSCATFQLPASRITFIACAPSAPMPVSMTPSALGPITRAADWKSTSTDGLWRFTGSPSRTRAMTPMPVRSTLRCSPPGAM